MSKDNKFIDEMDNISIDPKTAENPFVKFEKGVNDFFGELCDILDEIKKGGKKGGKNGR